jgi:hypothetical protein
LNLAGTLQLQVFSCSQKLKKAGILTSMAILSGLVSAELPARLIARRKDIMIESAAYEIIESDHGRWAG